MSDGGSDTHQLRYGYNGFRFAQPIAVGDLPDGYFCVESPLQKYFASPVGQIISTNSRHPIPQEGRIMIVTKRGVECGGRGSVLRARGSQGAFFESVSDQRARGREMLFAYGEVVWS